MPANLPLILRPPIAQRRGNADSPSRSSLPSGFIVYHPRYRTWLMRSGIGSATAALELHGEIVCGHPDRHVARVELRGRVVYLKREHRIGWRVRLRNAWAGFGRVSRSEREATTLKRLEAAGLPGPQWLAYGEDGNGRAFLLVDELTAADDLRTVLRDNAMSLEDRRLLAERIGRAIAELHEAGFSTPELAAKHVYASRRAAGITLLDWQSCRQPGLVNDAMRVHQLAMLTATVTDDLATDREKIRVLWAYRRVVRQTRQSGGAPVPRFSVIAREVERLAIQRRDRSSVRDQRSIGGSQQRLVWLADETVCAVPDVAAVWPTPAAGEPFYSDPANPRTGSQEWITFPDGRRSLLTRFASFDPLGRLIAGVRGKSWRSPGTKANRVLFHLERHSIPAPRLLAFGQKLSSCVRAESFVVHEPLQETVPVAAFVGTLLERREMLRRCGELLRRLHDSGCRLTASSPGEPVFAMMTDGEIAVESPFVVRMSRRIGELARWVDLRRLTRRILPNLSRTDRLRVIRAYASARTH